MNNEYILHVDISGAGQSKTDKAQTKLSEVTNKEPSGDSDNKLTVIGKDVQQKVVGAISAAAVVKVASEVVTYNLRTYGARNGDQAGQNKINNVMNIGKKAISSATAITAGFVAGGAVGGIAATAIIGIETAISALENKIEWNRQQAINNMNEVRSSERLGLMRSDRNR